MWRRMVAFVRPCQWETFTSRQLVGECCATTAVAGSCTARGTPQRTEAKLLVKRYSCLSRPLAPPHRSPFRANKFSVHSFSNSATAQKSLVPWLHSEKQQSETSHKPQTDKPAETAPGRVTLPKERQKDLATSAPVSHLKSKPWPGQDISVDADRRQRSLEQVASTSAATPAASTLDRSKPAQSRPTGSSPGASTSAASTPVASIPARSDNSTPQHPAGPPASEPKSQYAQKAGSEHGKFANKPIRDLLESKSITLPDYSPGQKRAQCPMCAGGSTHEESLALHISDDSQSAKWICHRATCGWEGGIDQASAMPRSQKQHSNKVGKPDVSQFKPLSPQLVEYFAGRGIRKETLERNRVAQEHTWMPGQAPATAVAFPYLRNGEVANVKYRTLDKRFRQVKGADKILYGLDDVVGQDTIIIVEGEIDKLSLEEAGFRNVVSVPDGAPAKVKEGALPKPDADTKYSYLWECRAVLDQASRILVATDNDAPGHALAEELARRLGRERCYRVSWDMQGLPPTDADTSGLPDVTQQDIPQDALMRKDANEVLVKDGPEALRQCIDLAEPLPIRGLFRFADFEQELWGLYNLEHSDQLGKSSGWPSLDEFYRVVPGELTIITGVPNSGKSEWIDALMVNLSKQFGWRFGLCSMEKKAKDHARQLMEKHLCKPFFDGVYAGSTPRLTPQDWEEGLAWINDRFFPIRYEDEALPSVDWVLNVAKAAVLRYGIRGLLIDPYNELDHQRPSFMSETEYVSQMLTKIKRFAQHHDVHVWFVAHPRQMRDWKGAPPTMYDISGSAHFINKADNGVVIHRNRDPQAGPMNQVQIFVRKVRNKAAGTIGDCYLEYDRVTGRYLDANQPMQSGNVLEAFVDPNEADRSQLQLPQLEPQVVLEPSSPASVPLARHNHAPETVRRHKDSGEVSWQDLEPQPDDQIRQYVGGRTA